LIHTVYDYHYIKMNPSGMHMEEKKLAEMEIRSTHSYKSTHSSRSSVLERAREYNRRIDEQNRVSRSRAKSLERSSVGTGEFSFSEAGGSSASQTPRSMSAGRVSTHSSATGGGSSRMSTRERAMKSVQKDVGASTGPSGAGGASTRRGGGVPASQTTDHTQPLTPASHMSSGVAGGRSHSSHVSRPAPTTPRTPPSANNAGPAAAANNNNNNNNTNNRRRSADSSGRQNKASPARSMKSSQQPKDNEGQDAIVTPELLVDALSGHEDGLLAIAEKLMEHYDAGYDVMGEAIIDAFADVQKLFQHVVEAAHMEGAAFEASRREVEMAELRRAAAAGELRPMDPIANSASSPTAGTPSGPTRHDEFIDQDVKDVLTEVIRQGASLREGNKHMECYELYEHACQQASSLLPVDSDHRGRLQLSIARAESMSADRACAILRYAMDDVLRSGLKAGPVPIPDLSKRADVVLNRPQGHSSMAGVTGQAGVVQSGDEALASLMEEMKEIMGAPVYKDTPLQSVARRFWMALNDAQKSQQKNEERLEQNLGKLKGDYLLARAVRYCYCALLCGLVCVFETLRVRQR
jgi:hypothetical protein